jgi:hypothetical protein
MLHGHVSHRTIHVHRTDFQDTIPFDLGFREPILGKPNAR